MKTKTRIAAMAAACLLLVSSLAALAGCSGQPAGSNGSAAPSTGKLTIMTTLFPQYDFARQVAGEHAEVSLLLPLGMESHSYEPTPADVVQIGKSDLFIYTGNYMEGWVSGILDNAASDSLTVLDVSTGIELDVEGEDGHDHHANDGHQHEYDPHIWTSPVLAKQMVENIAQTLCYIDPEHAADYQANARAYQEKLGRSGRSLPTGSAKRCSLAARSRSIISSRNMAWSMRRLTTAAPGKPSRAPGWSHT